MHSLVKWVGDLLIIAASQNDVGNLSAQTGELSIGDGNNA